MSTSTHTRQALLVEDDPFARQAVADFLTDLGFEVTTASTLTESLEQIETQPFVLAVIDLSLPRDNSIDSSGKAFVGLEIVRHVKRVSPRTRVVIWSAYTAEFMPDILKLVEEGHTGIACIPKGSPMAKFRNAINQVLSGDVYLSRDATEGVPVRVDGVLLKALSPDVASAVAQLVERLEQLSPQEEAVAARISKENHVIAEELGVSGKTVQNYINSIYDKLGLRDPEDGVQHLRRKPLIALAVLVDHLRRDAEV